MSGLNVSAGTFFLKFDKPVRLTHVGWMSTLGWLASMASSVFVCATLVEVCADVLNSEFGFTNWQYTLLMLGFIALTIGFNTVGSRTLPMLQTISLFGHFAGFVVVLIILWVMCPRNSASDVFTSFVNSGGWSNMGTACLVSQVTVMYCNLGSDSVVHICKLSRESRCYVAHRL